MPPGRYILVTFLALTGLDTNMSVDTMVHSVDSNTRELINVSIPFVILFNATQINVESQETGDCAR
jgi:hypothetical protein